MTSLVEALGDSVYVVAVPEEEGSVFTFSAVNQAFLDLCGRDRETLVGHPPQHAFGKADGDRMVRRWRHAIASEGPSHYTAFVDNKIAQSSLSPLRDASGRCTHLVCITRDDTAMREASGRLRTAFGYTSEGVAVLGEDQLVSEVLLGDAGVWGRSRAEVEGCSLSDLFVGDEVEGLERIWSSEAAATAQVLSAEVKLQTDDGSGRWAEVTVSNLLSEPSVQGVVLTVRDCDARRQTQVQLEEAEERLRTLLANGADALVGVDLDHRIVLWNRAAEEMFGYTESEILGSDMARLLPPSVRRRHGGLLRGFAAGDVARRHMNAQTMRYLHATRRDGRVFPIEVVIANVHSNGSVILLASVRDMTRRLEVEREVAEARVSLETAQEQLARAQKLEAVGQLAAGIAHEINTPMQYIGDNTHFLKQAVSRLLTVATRAEKAVAEDCSDESWHELTDALRTARLPLLTERAPKAVDDALSGVEAVSKIVAAMRRFSHPGSAEMQPIDLNASITDTMTVCRNEWKHSATIETDFEDDLPLVDGNLGPLNQVWLNLILNATHAIMDRFSGEMGEIRIRTRSVQGNEAVRVVVADNGAGIAEHNLGRIFDHFFTTKDVGKGTGQGLAIAHQVIVEEHGGSIEVDSTVGVGTAFTITLPRSHPTERDSPEAARSSAPATAAASAPAEMVATVPAPGTRPSEAATQ